MKKKLVIVILTISSLVLIISLTLFLRIYVTPILEIRNSQINNQETFLLSSQSPDGRFRLDAYRTEPGATVDYSIKVYIISGNQKQLVYDAYHEYDCKITWIDNMTVSINDKMLDLMNEETYDWRTQ